ncbi:cytochrome C biogenesis protein [Candidatus Woesebacteria bacterium]|nr:cytochrome C biogenesis protein [Candidatus Woesebacteria bacterium]|tara:strand:+ start:419 stop:1159 length:741 start_codon:yes stop_codon:yes gene_type:complete
MFDVSFPVAFASGLVSFFAPCVVPLLPAYVGYVTGVSLQDLKTYGIGRYRTKLFVSSIFYILGFSIIFVILGTAAAGVGQALRQYDDIIRIVGGALIFILGLNFAGFLPLPVLSSEHKLQLPAWVNHLGYGRAFLIGIVFATAWTPCVGAVLGAILSLAAVSGTATTGASLLFVYSLGISIPFMIVSLTLAQAPKYLSVVSRHIGTISKVAGILLAILGLLLLTDTYRFVNAWLFQMAFSLGYQIQ